MSRAAVLERSLGHQFVDGRLLEQALTHTTHGPDHYERLEFLGDGVLDCVISEALYARFPRADEGELSRLRESLVRIEALAAVAGTLAIAEYLRFDRRPVGSGLHGTPSTAMVTDALEAVFGAVFVDAGYEAARKVILHVYAPLIENLELHSVEKDAKSQLQECLQAKKRKLPEYRVVSARQAAQSNLFEVECVVPHLGLSTRGSGTSRQRAEQNAAKAMLEKLGR